MDTLHLYAKAQRGSSKASSKKSKARRTKKRQGRSKNFKDAGQNPGQPSADEGTRTPRDVPWGGGEPSSRRKKREGKDARTDDVRQHAGQRVAAEETPAPGAAGSSARRKKRDGRSERIEDAERHAGRTLADEEAPTPEVVPEGEPSSIAESKVVTYAVGALHFVDASLGLALVVYGGMIHVAQVTAASVCYGLLLLLGAVAGAVGHCCGARNGRGPRASAAVGLLTCLLDAAAFILVLTSWDSFLRFLGDHSEELLLSEDGVKTIEGLKIPMAVIFLLLSVFEGFRFYVMWAKANAAASPDQASPLAQASKRNHSLCDKFLSIFGLEKEKKIDDFVVFDDDASLERSLLWSSHDALTTLDPEGYLRFIPEHERGLTDFAETISMPAPPVDRVDY